MYGIRTPDTGLEYLTTVIQTNDISKSLDASHELDDESENKEQTQTMSTVASRGTNPELVEEMYNAIGNIIQDGLKDLNKQLVSVQYGRHE